MRILFLVLSLFTLLSNSASACQRCGLFGRLCRFQQQVVVQKVVKQVVPYVAPVVAAVPQQTLMVIQNSYPPAIGQLAYAPQGNSVYGYQAAAQAYSVSPSEVLRQAAELSRAATATASIGLTGFNQTAQTQLALQASISEPLARGHAAAQVLGAAGLSTPNVAAVTQSLSLKLSRGADGAWQVLAADPAPNTAPPAPLPVPRPESTGSTIARKCASCHGLSLTEPKGGVYLDAGHLLTCETVVKALKLIKTGKMPKTPMTPLTDVEKGQIFDELLTLEQERTE